MTARAYEVRYALDNYQHTSIRFGKRVGAVRYDALMGLRDAYPDLSFRHIRVRFAGVRETPREIADRKAAEFNRRYPVGTRVECTPFLDDDYLVFCTTVREPGAFVAGGDSVLVKIPGDAYLIDAVFPIVEVPA